jgi:hypothetical protein
MAKATWGTAHLFRPMYALARAPVRIPPAFAATQTPQGLDRLGETYPAYQAIPAGLDKCDSHRAEKSLDSIAYTCLVYACSEHAYDQILCPRSVSWRT